MTRKEIDDLLRKYLYEYQSKKVLDYSSYEDDTLMATAQAMRYLDEINKKDEVHNKWLKEQQETFEKAMAKYLEDNNLYAELIDLSYEAL